jgi:Spy/CpxP family protein refolding chaperone
VSRTKTTIVALIALAVTFVAGAAVGIVADRVFHRRHGIPEFATHALVHRLDRRLDLSDAQQKKVEEIIERHHTRINSFFSAVHPRVREEIEQANREIAAVLTPEQRRKFEEMKMHVGHRGGRTESTR